MDCEPGAGVVMSTELARYDTACRALAEARSVDEVKDIRDMAVAMAAYARQAKNKDLESDAVEIRMRATRRLDELRQAQKETVGLATGKEGKRKALGLPENPSDRPTLASQGIDKNLAQQARVLGKLSDEGFRGSGHQGTREGGAPPRAQTHRERAGGNDRALEHRARRD
jgi:hypothetical protein